MTKKITYQVLIKKLSVSNFREVLSDEIEDKNKVLSSITLLESLGLNVEIVTYENSIEVDCKSAKDFMTKYYGKG
jgi:hypothetical protein